MRNFLSRDGIRQIKVHGVKLRENITAAESFSANVKKYIEENKLDEDIVYNTDETGLN